MGVNPHVVVRRLSTVIVPIPRNIGFFLNEVIGKKNGTTDDNVCGFIRSLQLSK